MALLRQGLAGAARTRHIDEIRGEFLAIDTALARLQPGDLCLILVDQVQEALDHLAVRILQSKKELSGGAGVAPEKSLEALHQKASQPL